MLFAVWCFHHSTYSAQRYDKFQERQKHTLINLLFWREWNLPLAKFISVENNKPLKYLRIVWMIGYQVKTLLFMLFFVSTISSVVYLRCRMPIQAKPMNRKRFWSCLLSNGGRNCSKRFTAWPFLILKEAWLPLHPTKGDKWQNDGVRCLSISFPNIISICCTWK